jgi:NAD(P)H-hydrate epimerase
MDDPGKAPFHAKYALTAEQAREVDRWALERLGLPSIVLMENAAINVSSVVLDLLQGVGELDEDRFRVGIVCGTGNNGGDGFALARHLHLFGLAVTLYCVRPIEAIKGDAGIMANVAQNMGLPIVKIDEQGLGEQVVSQWAKQHVLVDALLGTGAALPLRGAVGGAVQAINRVVEQRREPLNEGDPRRPIVVAIDVPTGLDCDTGETSGPAVRADVTVTFVAPKVGFEQASARRVLGRVIVADIGVPVGGD